MQMHVDTPAIYLRLGDDSGVMRGGTPLTVDTHGAGSGAKTDSSGGSPDSGYVMVRADVRTDARVLASFNIGVLGGGVKQQEDVIETASEVLPGGHWMKVTPKRPLDFGEYALMEVVSENEINLGVWDFGVHPVAPENRDAIKPEPKRPVTLERRERARSTVLSVVQLSRLAAALASRSPAAMVAVLPEGTAGLAPVSRPRPATAMLSRVVLASYIMVSAARMMAGTLAPSSGKVARPKLPARARKRPWPVRKRCLAELLPEPHGGVDGGLLFQAGEQGDELVAAVAEAGVCGAEGAPHEAADLGQQAAADEVAVGVVDLLEVVEVDEEQAEAGLAVGLRRARSARPAGCRGGAR